MSIIQCLDHVSATVDDAEVALALFHERLGFPVGWPLHDFGQFKSGAVRLGNFNVEVVQITDPAIENDWPDQWLSLVPGGLGGLTTELENRGLHHGAEQQVRGPVPPDGQEGLLYTTVPLIGNFAGECGVRLNYYAFDHRATAASAANPLGAVEVDRIRIGATDPSAAIEIWQRLLVPTMFTGETWKFDEGPDLTVEACGDDELVGIVVRVESVDRAAQALTDMGIHEESTRLHDDGIGLAGIRFFFED
jgi:catechol 2,3-dioxygenase-like lactoylglutathione lyase family enzyme